MGDGGDLLSIDGQTGLGANSVSAIRNLGETAMTTTREAALEAALKGMIYATTSLSQEQDDGSHWCKIRREVLAQARAALSTPATEPAADTRVVTLQQLERWQREWAQTLTLAQSGGGHGLAFDSDRKALDEIRAIIGEARQ